MHAYDLDKLSKYFRKFGFGALTDVDIEGESKGIVPTIENDMQKKAFEKGQLITKEEFLK